MCPQKGCFTRKAADLALGGRRPYAEGICVVCNYTLWKSRRARDGTKFLVIDGSRQRRPVRWAALEELEAVREAGAISAGSAYEFWKQSLWEAHSLFLKSSDNPGSDYVWRMVYPPPRAFKWMLLLDIAWKFNAVRRCGVLVAFSLLPRVPFSALLLARTRPSYSRCY